MSNVEDTKDIIISLEGLEPGTIFQVVGRVVSVDNTQEPKQTDIVDALGNASKIGSSNDLSLAIGAKIQLHCSILYLIDRPLRVDVLMQSQLNDCVVCTALPKAALYVTNATPTYLSPVPAAPALQIIRYRGRLVRQYETANFFGGVVLGAPGNVHCLMFRKNTILAEKKIHWLLLKDDHRPYEFKTEHNTEVIYAKVKTIDDHDELRGCFHAGMADLYIFESEPAASIRQWQSKVVPQPEGRVLVSLPCDNPRTFRDEISNFDVATPGVTEGAQPFEDSMQTIWRDMRAEWETWTALSKAIGRVGEQQMPVSGNDLTGVQMPALPKADGTYEKVLGDRRPNTVNSADSEGPRSRPAKRVRFALEESQ